MVLKLYYDLLSQPSRALYIFLKLSGISFEPHIVKLGNGEHLTEEFKEKYSKFQKVPFIHEGNFKLAESIGILRYLCREYPVANHWYPKESKEQAKADEYLEWQHLNTRLFCAMYFQTKWLIPKLKGEQPPAEMVQYFSKNMIKTLENFQELFLLNGPFINGNEISYCDIAAACEIEQTRIAGYDARDYYPKIQSWIENVRRECNPFYDEAHALVNKLAKLNHKEIRGKL